MNHLDKNSLLNISQHGFRKGLCCSSNLLTSLESVTAHIDNKSNVDTVYLDLAKAFDKVPRQCLLQKLKAHGIQGRVPGLKLGFLTDIKECVWMALFQHDDKFGAEFRRGRCLDQFYFYRAACNADAVL